MKELLAGIFGNGESTDTDTNSISKDIVSIGDVLKTTLDENVQIEALETSTEKIKNGTKETVGILLSDGSSLSREITNKNDGSSVVKDEAVSTDGSKTVSTLKIDKDGNTSTKVSVTDADGNISVYTKSSTVNAQTGIRTEKSSVKEADGSSSSSTQKSEENGDYTLKEKATNAEGQKASLTASRDTAEDGTVTEKLKKTDFDGSVTNGKKVTETNGDYVENVTVKDSEGNLISKTNETRTTDETTGNVTETQQTTTPEGTSSSSTETSFKVNSKGVKVVDALANRITDIEGKITDIKVNVKGNTVKLATVATTATTVDLAKSITGADGKAYDITSVTSKVLKTITKSVETIRMNGNLVKNSFKSIVKAVPEKSKIEIVAKKKDYKAIKKQLKAAGYKGTTVRFVD